MTNAYHDYRNTPVGEQLGVYFDNRAELRRTMPIFPLSLRRFRELLAHAGALRSNRKNGHAHAA